MAKSMNRSDLILELKKLDSFGVSNIRRIAKITYSAAQKTLTYFIDNDLVTMNSANHWVIKEPITES